jgi:hypothetical protein
LLMMTPAPASWVQEIGMILRNGGRLNRTAITYETRKPVRLHVATFCIRRWFLSYLVSEILLRGDNSMNAQTASATPSRHVVPRVAEADSRLSRNHSGLLASLGFVVLLCVPSTTWAQAVAPPLGAASSFAVLSATPDVTNTGPTVVTGDLGVYPASSVIGFPPGTVTGTIYVAPDLAAQNAQAADLTAYGFLAAETCTTPFTGATDLAGMTLVPGVYCFDSSASNSGLLQLDAQGDPNAVWVFQTVSTLITGVGSHVVVINGSQTQACNVFWQVGTSATLFSGSTFVGNILAHTSITLQTAASLSGRAWAYTGEVTLDSNTVGGCSPNGALGSITIVKNTVGGNDTFPFTAIGAGVPAGFSITTTGNPGTGSDSFTGLSAGTYTFQETPIPAGFNLTDLVCVDPTNDSTVNLATGTATVNLAAGEAVTCTYTDTFIIVEQASITIVKNTVGGNDTFPFAASGVGVAGFSILTTGNTGSHSFTGLSAGTYTFQETPIPASWSLTGLVCVDPTNDSTVNLATGTASVNLAAGETVTCTYTDNLLPPPVANAPTLSEWAMILLAALLAIVGFVVMRRPAR